MSDIRRRTELRRLRTGALRTRTCALPVVIGFGVASCAARAPEPLETASPDPTRAVFVERFARSAFEGRIGDLLIVPKRGEVVTYDDESYRFMHGSPWAYDARVPLILYGPAFRAGAYEGSPSHQEMGASLEALLGLPPLPTATGRVLEALRPDAERPRVLAVLVLDAFRPDYLDRYSDRLPTLERLRGAGAWFGGASADFVPTSTSVSHTTLVTATDPRVHGITGNTLYDRVERASVGAFEGASAHNVMVPTLTDRWARVTAGRAVIAAQGGTDYPAVALAGHGRCFFGGRVVLVGFYRSDAGRWGTNDRCYRLPATLKERSIEDLLSESGGRWQGHDVSDPGEFRRSALFTRFEGEAAAATLRTEAFGADSVTDLFMANLKSTDYVSHKYGPFSEEMREAVEELDRQVGRIVRTLDEVAGPEGYALLVTADHGMSPVPVGDRRRRTYGEVRAEVNSRFDPKGPGVVLRFEGSENQMYLDHDRLQELGVGVDEVAEYLESRSWVAAAITAAEASERSRWLTPTSRSDDSPGESGPPTDPGSVSSGADRPTSATAGGTPRS